ncbi:MAG: PAS domain S-box protein [Ginsengibacter sp.]
MEDPQTVNLSFTTKDIHSLIARIVSNPIVVLDKNFRYIFINKAAEAIISISSEELLGEIIWEKYPFLSGSSLEISCRKALENQETIFLEQYYPNFDAWTEYNIHPFPNGIVMEFKNISNNKKQEKDALKFIKRNSLMIETMHDMFLLADEELNVVDVNTSLCEALSYTKQELLQMNICDMYKSLSKEIIYEEINKVLNKKAAFIDVRNKRKSGDVLDIEVTVLKLINEDKNHYAFFGREVTQFIKTQEELKITNQRFKLIGTATQDALWEVEISTQKKWANEIHQNMYGLTRNQPVPDAEAWQNRIDISDRKKVIKSLEKAIRDKKTVWTSEYLYNTENKGWINIYDRTHILYDSDQNAVRMLGSMTDVTNLKIAETAIKNEKELSDSIINGLPGIFYLINQEGKILRWNKNFEKILGYNKHEILSIHALDLFPKNEKHLIRKKIQDVFEKGKSEIEANFFTKDQQLVPYYLYGRLTQKNGVKCVIGMGVELTEIKKAKKAMHEMEQKILFQKVQQQKKIARAIIKTQETERNYIGAELHDNVNQILAGARMYLSIAAKKEDQIKEMIQYPLELLDTAINEIRSLTAKYVSPIREIELEELVEALVENLRQTTSIKVELILEITQDITADLKINIYRILQELITNLIKHANCTKAFISLSTNHNSVYLKVTDNGQGFSLTNKREGIGLSNISNRVDSFNGEISLKSEPGKGCCTLIKIPIWNNQRDYEE